MIKSLKQINSSYRIIKKFEKGMSNLTYLIEDNQKNKFVYRYPGRKNNYFVDYYQLEQHLIELKRIDITSKTVYYNPQTGIKISQYIEGENPTYNVDLILISNCLKKLHNSKLKFANYNHLIRLKKYEDICHNKDEKYFFFKKKWLLIYNKFLKQNLKYPTHGDSQLANIILTKNSEIKLIDWEFSGTNDYIYDIASFGNQDFQMSLKLLKVYKKNINSNHLKRLYGWRIFQCLQWHNVALFKNQIQLSKDLNVNFLKVSENYLNQVKNLLTQYEKI